MNLKSLLSEKRPAILKQWFELVLQNYPTDSSNFIKKQKDHFLNPIGTTLTHGLEGIFDELLKEFQTEKIFPFLNDLIKIKAVQSFCPSRAISFIFLLKRAIRDQVEDVIKKHNLLDELQAFEEQIDKVALLAFDIYMSCRERIFEIRVNEIKNMTFRLLKRADLIYDFEEQEQEFERTLLNQQIKG
jgi:hypothetical protein